MPPDNSSSSPQHRHNHMLTLQLLNFMRRAAMQRDIGQSSQAHSNTNALRDEPWLGYVEQAEAVELGDHLLVARPLLEERLARKKAAALLR